MEQAVPQCRADAERLDSSDPLRHTRALFDLPAGETYLVGHSLGPVTHAALAALNNAASGHWRRDIVGAWNSAGWFDLPDVVGGKIAPLIGASPREVLIADSVSLNLYKLAAVALPLARSKHLIVEDDEFPTDQYIIEALSDLSAGEFTRAAPGSGLDVLARTGGVLVLSTVNYRSAEVRDMAHAEQVARDAGGLIVWDLSHATGVLALDLTDAGAKLATGCTYKYLNGGPGAPAFVFVAGDLADEVQSPLPGWMGHARPFAFEPAYEPAPGLRRFASGTPPILSLAALSGALDAFDGLATADIEAKAGTLGDLVTARAGLAGLDVVSPSFSKRRGGHVSFRHPNGFEIVQALAARGIHADFRAPDTIRFGLSPLFLRHTDIWDAMDALDDILQRRAWDAETFRKRPTVT